MRYNIDKRYKLVPVSSGVSRWRVGGSVRSAHMHFNIYDGDADGKLVADVMCSYEFSADAGGKWTIGTVNELLGSFQINRDLFNGEDDPVGLNALLMELLVRPDVKMNNGDYNGRQSEFGNEGDACTGPNARARFICVVVDAQHDFIDGSLGSRNAQDVAPLIVGFCKWARDNGGGMLFTRDTHSDAYLGTHEGKLLPVKHCIAGTPGHELYDGLDAAEWELIDKTTFMASPATVGEKLSQLVQADSDDILHGLLHRSCVPVLVFGYCTSICVAANALMLRRLMPNTEIYALSDLCSDIDKESHMAGLKVMQNNQINIVTSVQAVTLVGKGAPSGDAGSDSKEGDAPDKE